LRDVFVDICSGDGSAVQMG